MGSRASSQAHLPGPPQQVELAYVAGLLDRSGGFCAARTNCIGLRLSVRATLATWLLVRFGGTTTAEGWCLYRRANLVFLLPRIRPYLVARIAECDAMIALLEHIQGREAYHGDAAWRERRDLLMADVRASRPGG